MITITRSDTLRLLSGFFTHMEKLRHIDPTQAKKWTAEVRNFLNIINPSPFKFNAIGDFAYIHGLEAIIALKALDRKFGNPETKALANFSLWELTPKLDDVGKIIKRRKKDPEYRITFEILASGLYESVSARVEDHIPPTAIETGENATASQLYAEEKTKLAAAIVILKAMEEEVSLN